YVVQHSDHWAFDGTGLSDGDIFGLDQQLVGYECDGANFDRTSMAPYTPEGDDGTPPEFVILAVGDVTHFGERGNGEAPGNKAATMGVYTAAGQSSLQVPWTGHELLGAILRSTKSHEISWVVLAQYLLLRATYL